MEIPDRDQHEAELLALLLLIFHDLHADIVASRVIPWEGYRVRLIQALTERLATTYVLAALVFAQSKPEFTLDERSIVTLALAWASSRATEIATRFVARAQTAAAQLLSVFGISRGERTAAADTIAGRAAAESIAITETTAAQSAGNRQAVQLYQVQSGVFLQGRWVTEEDGRVCPICRPLHDTPYEVWGQRFPLGPPAHPRCRCHLTY